VNLYKLALDNLSSILNNNKKENSARVFHQFVLILFFVEFYIRLSS